MLMKGANNEINIHSSRRGLGHERSQLVESFDVLLKGLDLTIKSVVPLGEILQIEHFGNGRPNNRIYWFKVHNLYQQLHANWQ